MLYFLIISTIFIISIASFYWHFHQHKAGLLDGTLLLICILCLIVLFLIGAQSLHSYFLIKIIISLLALFNIVLTFLLFLQALLWVRINFKYWHKENHTLAQPFIIVSVGVISVLFYFILYMLYWKSFLLFIFLVLLGIYLNFCLLIFIISAFLFLQQEPTLPKDYIIILGAGLLNGNQVSTLLAARIKLGLNFYQQQLKDGYKAPLLICSGGQGRDETQSEGQAMRDYLVQLGVAPKHIIMETNSHNTYENLVFSKKIITAHHLSPTRGIFVTSNYHVFRSGIIAAQVGLPITGLGSFTSYYFIFVALLREFAAIMISHKYCHFIAILLLIIIAIFITNLR